MSENKGFTIIQNEIINSGKISLKALGLLLFLKSKPTDWNFSVVNILKELKDGFTSLNSAMKELEDLKIIERKKTNINGRFGCTYIFLDVEKPLTEKPLMEKPHTENIPTVEPSRKKAVPKKPAIEEAVFEEVLFAEEAKPKPTPKKKTPPKSKTVPDPIYKKCTEIYFEWFEKLSGVKPKFDAIDGASLKKIISYFKSIHYDANDGTDEFQEVTKMFSIIFLKWETIDPFFQKQTKLNQINSNLQNIINDIKNKHTSRRNANSKDKSVDSRVERVQGAFSRIDEMLSKKR